MCAIAADILFMTKNPRITTTKEGLHVLKDDTHISRWVEEHGSLICDPYLFKWLLPKIAGSKIIWDVGAFIGDHTAAYVGLEGVERVYAFEPNPDAFFCLEANLGDKARCWNVAASDRKERLSFNRDPNAGASRLSEEGAATTQAVPLDTFMQGTKPPDFIKIDVEGWEPRALKGMRRTIKKHRPKVFIEVNNGALEKNGFSNRDIFDFFSELGYPTFLSFPEKVEFDDPQYDVLFMP